VFHDILEERRLVAPCEVRHVTLVITQAYCSLHVHSFYLQHQVIRWALSAIDSSVR
jgi:hypothetical protein